MLESEIEMTGQVPDAAMFVLLEITAKSSRRCRRIAEPIDEIARLALQRKIKVKRFSRGNVRKAFAESAATTKQEIATAIANRFPELTPRVPRYRKPWMSEDYRMSIFDAAALAVAFFHCLNCCKFQ